VTWLDTLRRWLRLEGGRVADTPLPRCLGARTAHYLDGTAEYSLEARALLDHLLLDAVHAGASDVHLDPFEDHILARFRIDGILHDVARLPASLKGALANRVKVMADLKIHEHRVPQDGKARMDAALGGYEMRVSLSPMVGGEKVSIRLFRPGERRFNVQSLGFDPETLREFLRLVGQPNGLILLAGPVGSGKTTTLYTALTHLTETRGERLNITTVEDPVECTLPRVNQASVNVPQGFTYPIALRSILRHDPQVIMIGEIRDEETAGIAVRASLSGHLVLSTVHSGTAAGAFARLINLKVDAPLLASATLGVLNIRLVRVNCPTCAQPYEPDAKLLARLGGRDLEHASFRHGAGCAACGFTGFRGRAPLTEFLVMNPELEKLVSTGAPAVAIHELALKNGMQPLSESALRRVFAGETTLEEVGGYLG
jgi:type II secretory ATPase GspE/PulE/Tfp pilus assembly ATPase PilB-like protein